MAKVLLQVAGVWCVVIVVILLMTAISPAMNDIAAQSANEIAASGNMSQIVGVQDAVASYPIWKWGLPVVAGVVITGIVFYKNREELRRR